jgi:hypothetical protein
MQQCRSRHLKTMVVPRSEVHPHRPFPAVTNSLNLNYRRLEGRVSCVNDDEIIAQAMHFNKWATLLDQARSVIGTPWYKYHWQGRFFFWMG